MASALEREWEEFDGAASEAASAILSQLPPLLALRFTTRLRSGLRRRSSAELRRATLEAAAGIAGESCNMDMAGPKPRMLLDSSERQPLAKSQVRLIALLFGLGWLLGLLVQWPWSHEAGLPALQCQEPVVEELQEATTPTAAFFTAPPIPAPEKAKSCEEERQRLEESAIELEGRRRRDILGYQQMISSYQDWIAVFDREARASEAPKLLKRCVLHGVMALESAAARLNASMLEEHAEAEQCRRELSASRRLSHAAEASKPAHLVLPLQSDLPMPAPEHSAS